MKKQGFRQGLVVYGARRGAVAPYCLIIAGIYGLLTTPLNIDRLEYYSGAIESYTETDFEYLNIEEIDNSFRVDLKKNREILRDALPNSKNIELWATEKTLIKQIKVDGAIRIEYKWLREVRVGFVFIMVGLILLPFTTKEWRKMKANNEV